MELLQDFTVPTNAGRAGGLRTSAYLPTAVLAAIISLPIGQTAGFTWAELGTNKDKSRNHARVLAHRLAMELFGRESKDARKHLPEFIVGVLADREMIFVKNVGFATEQALEKEKEAGV